MRSILFALIFLYVSNPAFSQTPLDMQYVTAGRADLAAQNLVAADTNFVTAVAADPTDQTAAALLGLTRLAALSTQPAFQNYLNGMGVTSTGRNIYNWTALLAQNTSGKPTLPAGYNLTTALAYLQNVFVPESINARANFATVSNPGFLLSLTSAETDIGAVNVDYGDILMCQALLRAGECLTYLLAGQNDNGDLSAALSSADNNLLTVQSVLTTNPSLLTAGSFANRTAAQAALLDAIQLYNQASAFIRARPPGERRLFMIDPAELAQEALFRSDLNLLTQSVSGLVPYTNHGAQYVATTAPLFGSSWSLRALLPPISATGFDPGSIPDVTLGGVIGGLNEEMIAAVLARRSLQGQSGSLELQPTLGWSWVTPLPQGNSLNHYTYTGSEHIVVGNAGTVMISADGVHWTYSSIPGAGMVTGIAYGNGIMVAVGPSGIFVSTDSGSTWSGASGNPFIAYYNEPQAVIFDGTRFVAVGSYGTTAISTDGQSWTGSYVGFGGVNFSDLTYDGGLYVAVGSYSNASQSVIYTSPNGTAWTLRATGTNGTSLSGVCYGGGKFVAVGSPNLQMTSSNGTSWTTGTVLPSGAPAFSDVAFRSGTYVACGSGGVLASSSNGTAWNAVSFAQTVADFGVEAGPDAFYVTGARGTILRSTDGRTFVDEVGTPNAETSLFAARTVGSNLYLAGAVGSIGNATGNLFVSNDGENFSAVATGSQNAIWSLWNQGQTLYVAGDNGMILASPDGVTWSARTSNTVNNLRILTNLNGKFLAAGANGTMLTSSDGITWTPRTTGVSATIYGLAYGAGVYVAVGGDNFGDYCILTSPDGISWTPRQAGIYTTLRGIVYSQGYFVAVGTYGALCRSPDGISWTSPSDSGSYNDLLGIQVVDGRLCALSAATQGGYVDSASCSALLSTDGLNWVTCPLPTDQPQYAVAFFQSKLITAGSNGSLLTATRPAQPPPVVVASSPGQSAAVGSAVTLAAVANSDGITTYQWSLNGVPIQGANGISYSISDLQSSNSGSYTLAVSNAAGSTSSSPSMVVANAVSGGPVLTNQPNPQTIANGSTVVFSVNSNGSVQTPTLAAPESSRGGIRSNLIPNVSATTYQWYLNGSAISGAIDSILVVTASSATAGTYTCLVVNSSGSILSSGATLNVVNTADPGRLGNISVNSVANSTSQLLTVGFVTGGAGTIGAQSLLIRATGPALTGFGVSGVMPDPQLKIFDNNSNLIASNAGWASSMANEAAVQAADAATGAFALTNLSSLDSATVQNLATSPGYTVQVSSVSGQTGRTLAEVFDDTPAGTYSLTTPRLVNLSCRILVNAGGTLIEGFTIGGTTNKTVLVRASGPALAAFGVTNVMPDPQIQVYGANETLLAYNAGWGGDPAIAAAAANVYAFPFTNAGSNDCAVLMTLPPGGYTAVASSVSGVAGNVLIEVYEVP